MVLVAVERECALQGVTGTDEPLVGAREPRVGDARRHRGMKRIARLMIALGCPMTSAVASEKLADVADPCGWFRLVHVHQLPR